MSLKRDTTFVYIDQGVEKEIKVVGSKKIEAKMKVTRAQQFRNIVEMMQTNDMRSTPLKRSWGGRLATS
jgi:hypothetical protein